MSLRGRLALLFTAGSAVILVLAALLIYLDLNGELQRTINNGLMARAEDIEGDINSGRVAIRQEEAFAQILGLGAVVVDSSAPAPAALSPTEVDRASRHDLFIDRRIPHTPALGRRARLLAHPVAAGGRTLVVVVGASTEAVFRGRERLALILLILSPLLALVHLGALARVRPARAAEGPLSAIAGVGGLIGFGFHLLNISRRSGSFSWQNFFYGPPAVGGILGMIGGAAGLTTLLLGSSAKTAATVARQAGERLSITTILSIATIIFVLVLVILLSKLGRSGLDLAAAAAGVKDDSGAKAGIAIGDAPRCSSKRRRMCRDVTPRRCASTSTSPPSSAPSPMRRSARDTVVDVPFHADVHGATSGRQRRHGRNPAASAAAAHAKMRTFFFNGRLAGQIGRQ